MADQSDRRPAGRQRRARADYQYGMYGWDDDIGRSRRAGFGSGIDYQYGMYGWDEDIGRSRRDEMARPDWTIPGPYTGRGPRGYQRTDERIPDDVCDRLTQHGQLDARDIDVSARDGEVTLQGTVHSRQAKRLAEDIAESVSGVRDVHNRLRLSGSRGG